MSKNHKSQLSIWQGPVLDGITQSLLCKFIICRERFRLYVVEGFREDLGFNHYIEYGNLFHGGMEYPDNLKDALKEIARVAGELKAEHPTHHEEIIKWEYLAAQQYKLYVKHWQKKDAKRERLLSEETFDYMYELPSGRLIRLRGKWDGVYQNGKRIILQENKTKGIIDEEGLQKTLHENIQVMFYYLPLFKQIKEGRFGKGKVGGGILYNVIKRPLSDKYAIRQKKSETQLEFFDRAISIIEAEPDKTFKRWRITVTQADIQKFLDQCLHPLLEQLLDWWEAIEDNPFEPWDSSLHFRRPFGVYDGLAAGFRGDFFDLISQGVTSGLNKVSTVFPELDE